MIGVIGATGMVGAAVAERLHSAGLPILLGGRRRSSINHPTHADIEITQVDITDSVSLDAFCRSCSIVVNCAGPSYRILDTVARTALSNGAHYVDPAGDDPVYTRLERPPGPQKAAVVSAGLLPGVSAMLLSWLADRLDEPVHRLSCLAGGTIVRRRRCRLPPQRGSGNGPATCRLVQPSTPDCGSTPNPTSQSAVLPRQRIGISVPAD